MFGRAVSSGREQGGTQPQNSGSPHSHRYWRGSQYRHSQHFRLPTPTQAAGAHHQERFCRPFLQYHSFEGADVYRRQADLRTRFGVSLSDTEAALFLHVQAQDHIRILEAQSVAVATEQDTKAVLDRLVLQRLLDRHEDPNGPFFTVAEHLKAAPAALAAITAPLGFVPTEKQWQILAFCDSPKSILQLMNHLGVTSRPHFRHDHPDALVAQQLIRLSDPTKPTSPRQTYVLTDAGFAILADKERGLFAPQAAPVDPAKLSPSGTTASRSRLT